VPCKEPHGGLLAQSRHRDWNGERSADRLCHGRFSVPIHKNRANCRHISGLRVNLTPEVVSERLVIAQKRRFGGKLAIGGIEMILQINFTLTVPASDYEKLADSVAQAFAEVPGLKWKIWLLNPGAQEAGGIYLFESQATVDAFLNGPLVAQVKALPAIRNLSVKQFEVMPEVTAVTRGPVGVIATARA
jgi:hypothetical protein